MTDRHRLTPAITLATAAVYLVAAKLGLSMAVIAEQVTVVWPPTGIALAAVLVLGRRAWAGIFLGAFLANATAHEPTWTAAGVAAGNTVEALIGAWLLERVGFRRSLDRLHDVLALVVLAAAGSTIASATIGVASLCLGGVQPWSAFPALWWTWWIGDVIGDLVMAPLLLVWTSTSLPPRLTDAAIEAAALGAGTAVTSVLVFAQPSALLAGFPLHYTIFPYTIFPFVIWAGLRFGQRGTSAVTFVVSAVAIWSTVHGRGPFTSGSPHSDLLMLQVYMATVAVTGFFLGAAITERDHAERRATADYERLRASEERLRVALEELRERAAALSHADTRKDEFLAMLAHELRNPLSPLGTALHLLRVDDAGRSRFLDMAERQVRQLVRLVDDLLDVSRITRGKITLRRERVALAEIVGRAVETVRQQIDSRGQSFTLSLPPAPVELDADPTRLAQVLANLLANAAKYTAPGGAIYLTAERVEDELTVRVRDTGAGLSAELLPHVFDLFVQGDASLDRPRGGLGIGLTIVRRLVELHGGRVEARSAGPGHGSEFIIHLPAVPERFAAAPEETGRASEAPATAGLRILIVEDNADAAESLAVVLSLWGHEPRVAYDGTAALEAAERFAPDVILSDIGLPGMDGYELARRLRAHPQVGRAVLVALSGYGREEDKRRALDAGFDHHLVKPPDFGTLVALLGRVAVSSEQHRARTVH